MEPRKILYKAHNQVNVDFTNKGWLIEILVTYKGGLGNIRAVIETEGGCILEMDIELVKFDNTPDPVPPFEKFERAITEEYSSPNLPQDTKARDRLILYLGKKFKNRLNVEEVWDELNCIKDALALVGYTIDFNYSLKLEQYVFSGKFR